MAQEIGQLRAQVGQIDDLRTECLRLSQAGEALLLERDQLRSVLGRISELAQRAGPDPPRSDWNGFRSWALMGERRALGCTAMSRAGVEPLGQPPGEDLAVNRDGRKMIAGNRFDLRVGRDPPPPPQGIGGRLRLLGGPEQHHLPRLIKGYVVVGGASARGA